jgi:CrcB protein
VSDDGIWPERAPIDPDLSPSDPAEPSRLHRPQPGRTVGRARPDVLASTAVGGALGATARYEMGRVVHVGANGFPWATFTVNLTGSLVLGIVAILVIEHLPPTRFLRPFAVVGFLGAYTTYSTYMVEADVLVKNGHVGVAMTYVVASALLGLLFVWVGMIAGRRLPVWRPAPAISEGPDA